MKVMGLICNCGSAKQVQDLANHHQSLIALTLSSKAGIMIAHGKSECSDYLKKKKMSLQWGLTINWKEWEVPAMLLFGLNIIWILNKQYPLLRKSLLSTLTLPWTHSCCSTCGFFTLYIRVGCLLSKIFSHNTKQLAAVLMVFRNAHAPMDNSLNSPASFI